MRPEKKSVVKEFVKEFNGANPVVFTSYSGIKVNDISQFRMRLGEIDAKYRVVQNRILGHALDSMDMKDTASYIKGPTGVVYGGDDVVEVIKLVVKFAKDSKDSFVVKGGIVDNNVYDVDSIEKLSKLPSRQELIAKLVGQIGAPLSGLVIVLQANIRKLVVALGEINKKKEGK